MLRPYHRQSSGVSHTATAQDDELDRAFATVVPEWLRGSRLLDNYDAATGLRAGYSFVANTMYRIPHGLGRPHRGWFLVGPTSDTGEEIDLIEVTSANALHLTALANTHLQLVTGASSVSFTARIAVL